VIDDRHRPDRQQKRALHLRPRPHPHRDHGRHDAHGVFVITVKKRYMLQSASNGPDPSARMVTPSRNPSVTNTASAISAARTRR
jgi:hypothetical protein